MLEILKPFLGAAARHLLTAFAGVLVARGLLPEQQVAAFVGAGLLFLGVGWSAWQKLMTPEILARLLARVEARIAAAKEAPAPLLPDVSVAAKAVIAVMATVTMVLAFTGSADAAAVRKKQMDPPMKAGLAELAPLMLLDPSIQALIQQLLGQVLGPQAAQALPPLQAAMNKIIADPRPVGGTTTVAKAPSPEAMLLQQLLPVLLQILAAQKPVAAPVVAAPVPPVPVVTPPVPAAPAPPPAVLETDLWARMQRMKVEDLQYAKALAEAVPGSAGAQARAQCYGTWLGVLAQYHSAKAALETTPDSPATRFEQQMQMVHHLSPMSAMTVACTPAAQSVGMTVTAFYNAVLGR